MEPVTYGPVQRLTTEPSAVRTLILPVEGDGCEPGGGSGCLTRIRARIGARDGSAARLQASGGPQGACARDRVAAVTRVPGPVQGGDADRPLRVAHVVAVDDETPGVGGAAIAIGVGVAAASGEVAGQAGGRGGGRGEQSGGERRRRLRGRARFGYGTRGSFPDVGDPTMDQQPGLGLDHCPAQLP